MTPASPRDARDLQMAVARGVLVAAFRRDFSEGVIDGILHASVARARELPDLAGAEEFAAFRIAQERLQALAGQPV